MTCKTNGQVKDSRAGSKKYATNYNCICRNLVKEAGSLCGVLDPFCFGQGNQRADGFKYGFRKLLTYY